MVSDHWPALHTYHITLYVNQVVGVAVSLSIIYKERKEYCKERSIVTLRSTVQKLILINIIK